MHVRTRSEVTDIAMGNLIELIKTESDTECLATAIEAICSLVCADEEDFEEGPYNCYVIKCYDDIIIVTS